MLEDLVETHEGRELAAKDELDSGEVGVQVQSDNLLGLYAFPDRAHASHFMMEAAEEFVIETGEMGTANVFENQSLLGRIKSWFTD